MTDEEGLTFIHLSSLVISKERLQLRMRRGSGERLECAALCQLLRGANKPAPGRPRQGATYTDSADTEFGGVVIVRPPGALINKLNDFGATAFTTAAISSRSRIPGAYRQSAPASA